MSLIRHEVDPCPRCGGRHRFAIEVSAPEQETVLFGGPGEPEQGVEVGFTCPEGDELFTDHVALPAGVRLVRVITSGGAPLGETTAPPALPDATEFADWARRSRALATDFCRTMLTTASGAIPVYFAVLNYLGTERVEGSLGSKASVLPPMLFLAAIVLFALALRPQLASLTTAAFEEYRSARLRRLDRFIAWGVAAFGAGMAAALGVFVRALGTI